MRQFAVIEWTDKNVETLRSLLPAGLSAQQIADQLGVPNGRCAVLGKIHRLGLKLARPASPKLDPEEAERRRVERTKKWNDRIRAEKIAASIKLRGPRVVKTGGDYVDPIDEPENLQLPLVELRACQCHWPTIRDEDEGRWLFCGAVTEPERSYCAYHRQIGTEPRRARPSKSDRHKYPAFGFPVCVEA